jgi:hypothetical protein
MALQVSADAIRALIPDGVYRLQVLEQRDTQRVVVTLTLASRHGGHTLQIETTEAHILAFFQRLLSTAPPARQPATGPGAARKRAKRAGETPEQQLMLGAAPEVAGPPAAKRRTRLSRQ